VELVAEGGDGRIEVEAVALAACEEVERDVEQGVYRLRWGA
jgi:hypothetical protein